MNRTVLVLMMAVTVEALVEYAKTFGKAILEKQWKTAATQAGAVALGVSLCFTKQDKSEPYASWRRVRICCFYPSIGLRRNGTGFSCATACRKRSPIGGLFLVSEEGMRYNGVGR